MRSACWRSTCRSPPRKYGAPCMALRAERRSLVYAIGLSLSLHAAVLALRLPVPTGGQRGAPPIVAYLAPTEAPAVPMRSARAAVRAATRGGQAAARAG